MSDYYEVPADFYDRFTVSSERIDEQLESLGKYEVPRDEALRSIERKYRQRELRYNDKSSHWVKIPKSPSGLDPSNIRDIPREVTGREAEELGATLQHESEYVVYYVSCKLAGGSRLKDTERECVKRLPKHDEPPDWLYYAWKADNVYYVGQTADLGQRIKAHACHTRLGDGGADEPALLTAISRVLRAGVVRRCESREEALTVESEVGEKWSREHNRRFVYFA